MRLARDWGEKESMEGFEASRSSFNIVGRLLGMAGVEEEMIEFEEDELVVEMTSFNLATATAMETRPWLSNSANLGLARAIRTQKALLMSEAEVPRDAKLTLARLERAAERQIVSELAQSAAAEGRTALSSAHDFACFMRVVFLLQSTGDGPNKPCSSKSRSA